MAGGGVGKKKLLMLNGGYNEIPLIQAAHRLGFYVITTGNDAAGKGHRYADEYVCADFSDREAIMRLANEKEVVSISSASNDLAALSAAYSTERLGLPGHDSYATSRTFHEKDEFRRVASALGLNVPQSRCFSSIEEACDYAKDAGYPLMVKPPDLSGGKGVTRIDSPAQAEQAIIRAHSISKAKRVIVEDYVEGSQHGFICYIKDKKVVFDISTNDYSNSMNPWMVCASTGHDAHGYEGVRASILADVEKFAEYTNASDGFLTMQYMMRDGVPWYIETMRRCLGNLHFLSLSEETGVDWNEWFIASEAGMDCDRYINSAHITDIAAGFLIPFASRNGHIRGIEISPEFQRHVFHEEWLLGVGDTVEDKTKDKVGVLSFSCTTEERDSLFSDIDSLVSVF